MFQPSWPFLDVGRPTLTELHSGEHGRRAGPTRSDTVVALGRDSDGGGVTKICR